MSAKWKIQFAGIQGWYDLRESDGEAGSKYRLSQYDTREEAREEVRAMREGLDDIEPHRIVRVGAHPEEWTPYDEDDIDPEWVEYPLPLNAVGNFVEDLDVIARLLGTILYESKNENGKAYIRRIC